MVTLYNGDCLEVMKNIADKSVDMILCDLPYGVTHNKIDVVIPFHKLWAQYNRIIKDNGVIALFGQGLFFIDLVNSNRENFKYEYVWDKVLTSNFLNANKMPLRRHEQVAIFYKGKPTYNSQYSQGKPIHSKGTQYLSKDTVNNNYGAFEQLEDFGTNNTDKCPTSILRFQKPHPSKALHPTEKSVELLEFLINTYTNYGETVLDNTMGSGSTGEACLRTGRDFIGIEVNPEYFDVARQRLEGIEIVAPTEGEPQKVCYKENLFDEV